MNSAERNYPTGEQELLAVVKSLEHWRYYLEGCVGGLTVVTDHKRNTFLSIKPPALLSRRQVRCKRSWPGSISDGSIGKVLIILPILYLGTLPSTPLRVM